VFVTEPISRTNVSVGDRMKLTDWRQRHVSKNLENSWKTGRYFLFCDGRNEIPYEVCYSKNECMTVLKTEIKYFC
jgi:hypothetical protein